MEPAACTTTFRYRVVKRLIDIVLSAGALIVLSPLILVLALWVRASSPGPAFYRWEVVGFGGHPFRGYKFRSMVANADALKAALGERNEMSGPVFKMRDDPRITPIGRWLRRYSLDELPQLWSVLKGDMSLVGPRPPLQTEWVLFEDWQRRKLSVVPGITCLWQARGRNDVSDFADWARLDLEYIDSWSLGLDFRIILETVAAVFRGTGH